MRTYNWINSDNAIDEYLIEHLKEQKIGDRYYLISYRDDEQAFIYSVDKNEVLKVDRDALLNPKKDNPELTEFINDIGAATGGITLGYKAIDLIKNASKITLFSGSKQGRNKIVTAIVGSVSGYYTGRWVAEKMFLPKMDSEKVLRRLSSKHFWIWAESKRIALVRSLIFAFIEADKESENPKLEEIKDEWTDLLKEFDYEWDQARFYDFTSKNFDDVIALRDKTINLLLPPEEDREWYEEPVSWFIGFVVLVFGGITISICSDTYKYRRKVRRLRSLNKRVNVETAVGLIVLLHSHDLDLSEGRFDDSILAHAFALHQNSSENKLVKSFSSYGVVGSYQIWDVIRKCLNKKKQDSETEFNDRLIEEAAKEGR